MNQSAAFDLVLMDVQMPVLDGLETTRLIRKEARWKHLPIIAMTAHAMNGDKERCLEAGMNGYISKPVHPSLLLSTVDEFLLPENTANDGFFGALPHQVPGLLHVLPLRGDVSDGQPKHEPGRSAPCATGTLSRRR